MNRGMTVAHTGYMVASVLMCVVLICLHNWGPYFGKSTVSDRIGELVVTW